MKKKLNKSDLELENLVSENDITIPPIDNKENCGIAFGMALAVIITVAVVIVAAAAVTKVVTRDIASQGRTVFNNEMSLSKDMLILDIVNTF